MVPDVLSRVPCVSNVAPLATLMLPELAALSMVSPVPVPDTAMVPVLLVKAR